MSDVGNKATAGPRRGIHQWGEFVRFEVVNQFSSRSLWVLLALFLFPLIGIIADTLMEAKNQELVFNAPLYLARYGAIMGVIALLLIAVVAGDAATRDIRTRMEPLMHAAPIDRAAYVGGRFLGAFLVVAVLLAIVPLTQLIVPHFNPELGEEVVGPVRAAAYLQTYFLLIVPNAFVGTAVLFALATLVRHAVGSYAGALILFAAMQSSLAFVGGRLGRWDLAKLTDSTGLTAISVMSRSWSPLELNERLIASEPALLWNRLLWIGIATIVLAFTIRRFRFAADAISAGGWWRWRVRSERPGEVGPVGQPGLAVGHNLPVAAPHSLPHFGFGSRVSQTLAIARDSLRELATPWALLVLPVLALKIMLSIDAMRSMGSGTMIFAATGRILAPLDDLPPPVVLAILMFPVILAGEILWRERDANMQSLTDSTPVSNGAHFVGKLLGLWTVMIVVHVLLIVAAVVAQVSLGWYDVDWALLFQIVLGFELVDALVFSLFALAIHIIANQKHVGHLLVILLIAASNIIAGSFSIEHPLLLLGFEPEWSHSAIRGFEPFLGSVLSFELYWAAWALVLALVARLFWVRGAAPGMMERLRLGGRRLTRRAFALIAAAAGLVLFTGGFIFYNTNILNTYEPPDQRVRRQAEYERRYGRYANTPQPQMTATRLHMEIWPGRRAADVRGVHDLVNHTDQPIEVLHVAISPAVETGEIELSRPSRAAISDDERGHRAYQLNQPLKPGEALQMSWKVRHEPRGFSAGEVSTAVVKNGSFILMQDWMPLIGYQPGREVTNAVQRKELGLPEKQGLPAADDLAARHDRRGREQIDLDITIGTSVDQVAVTTGTLQRTWRESSAQGPRRYFHYATTTPVGTGYAILSANYDVRRSTVEVGPADSAREVQIEIFHHPEHHMNVDRMIRSMEVSLAQFTERFGPYSYEVLRMIEYPSEGGSLHAGPGVILYQELFSLMDPENERRRIDLPFAVVAHEVAHQFQPAAAGAEGIMLLSESFSWYAAMGVIEQEYGAAHLHRFLGFMREAYLQPRSRAGVPLLRASDWFLGYRKGPLAMYALREYVGQERIDLAWRRLRVRHASYEPPFATSLDLYGELKKVTPEPLHSLLADLLERNTFWELKTTGATAQPIPGGKWQLSLQVEARKVVVDEEGRETEVPMDDPVEIGAFAPAGEELYRSMHRIRSGAQTMTITVPFRPARAGIDPRHLLIDTNPKDNVAQIK
jgi:ABC-2 type transport system permease protein